MVDAQWRQRLLDGSYSIRAAGIYQVDPSYFAGRDGNGSPTANVFRGAIQTAGQFALNDKWVWGWTGILMTDTQFLFDYRLRQFSCVIRSVSNWNCVRGSVAALSDRRR